MPTIALIDDDYASEIVIENLRNRGYEAFRIKSAQEALASLDKILAADLVILDMIMARPTEGDSPLSGDLRTGMDIFRALRERRQDLPILVFSATRDRDLMDAISNNSNVAFLSKWSTPSLDEIQHRIEQLAGKGGKSSIRSFIVHGHDEVEKLALKNYIQNTLKLPEPTILHELPSFGKTVIEKLESVDLVFALLTPDDVSATAADSNSDKRRARQNVIFELGYFLGCLGRTSGRVFLLHKGPLELPSDLAGVVYIDIAKGVVAAGEDIRREMRHVLG